MDQIKVSEVGKVREIEKAIVRIEGPVKTERGEEDKDLVDSLLKSV